MYLVYMVRYSVCTSVHGEVVCVPRVHGEAVCVLVYMVR